MRVRPWIAALLLPVVLAGCGRLFERPLPGPCPKVSILRDAEQVFRFRPGERWARPGAALSSWWSRLRKWSRRR